MSELHKFIFEGLPVRGMLVRLTDAWREVLRRRDQGDDPWPQPVRSLLGEMAAAGALMQANIKFDGALVLQVFGDGPVKLAVAEVQPDLAFRATAKVDGEVPEGAGIEQMLNVHGGGRCAITLDPRDKLPGQQPYQGVVPLHGDQREPLQQLSEVLEHYMLQSEQLDTKLMLAANDEVAAGLLIQRLPRGRRGQPRQRAQRGRHRPQRRLQPHRDAGLDADRRRTAEPRRRHPAAPPVLGGDAAPLRADARRARPRFACSCSRERVRRDAATRSAATRWTASSRNAARSRWAASSAASSTTSTRSTWASCSRHWPPRHPDPRRSTERRGDLRQRRVGLVSRP